MSDALATINRDEVEAWSAPIIREAEGLLVRNVDEHRYSLQILGRVMDARDRIKLIFKPALDAAIESKRKAEAARLEVVALQDSLLSPVLAAYDIVKAKAGAFEAAEKAAALANQEAINAEALAKQEQQRLMDAAMNPDDADAIMAEALPPPLVPKVQPEVAKVAGVSSRFTWTAQVTDKAEFIAWCLNSGNLYLLEVNQVALNSRARTEKAQLRIPGVKAVESVSYARRGNV